MANNSCTFIIIPDAKSQCKRYIIPNSVFYILGIVVVVLLVTLSILIHTMLDEYTAVSKKVEQLEKLKKISLSRKNAIDRYEEDITQLSNELAYIKQRNSRLMILTGLDPERGENNLGLGGSEEESSKVNDQESDKNGRTK